MWIFSEKIPFQASFFFLVEWKAKLFNSPFFPITLSWSFLFLSQWRKKKRKTKGDIREKRHTVSIELRQFVTINKTFLLFLLFSSLVKIKIRMQNFSPSFFSACQKPHRFFIIFHFASVEFGFRVEVGNERVRDGKNMNYYYNNMNNF